jgi:hypothetical protein
MKLISLVVCLCQGQRNKVKKTFSTIEFIEFFFSKLSSYLLKTKIAGP